LDNGSHWIRRSPLVTTSSHFGIIKKGDAREISPERKEQIPATPPWVPNPIQIWNPAAPNFGLDSGRKAQTRKRVIGTRTRLRLSPVRFTLASISQSVSLFLRILNWIEIGSEPFWVWAPSGPLPFGSGTDISEIVCLEREKRLEATWRWWVRTQTRLSPARPTLDINLLSALSVALDL
jgi:hypothetical protein